MKQKQKFQLLLTIMSACFFFFTGCKKNPTPNCGDGATTVTITKVFATGLNSPRGLKFGPDGNLYVAEAGLGGTNSTAGLCEQVTFPVGPYLGSTTSGRVSKIDRNGVRTTVTDKLPSSVDQEIVGGDFQGVADVAFVGNKLYALLAGAGCSHGVPSVPNGIVKIENDGSWSLVSNLSEYTMTHPVAHPEPHGGLEPDGTPYGMINVNGDLYVTEPNQGDIVKVTIPGGLASRVVDISVTQGHIVPTVIAFHEGNFYMGNLDTFPVVKGQSGIYKITPGGSVQPLMHGFTTVLGIDFDQQGRLYVLENSTVDGQGPTPNTGDIVRVDLSGKKEIIVSGLAQPTGMTFGPDGKLYVSNKGFGPGSTGGGEILQITFKCEYVQGDAKK
ncbi:MAG: ScyD/ScyE family protein [Ginsengibacter sp.]